MSRQLDPLRVLLIDDERDMCWALERIVEGEGCIPIAARSAREALAIARREQFGLVFVDAKLPDMEGLALAAHLRDEHPDVPCVLVSGYLYDDDKSVQSGLAAGIIRSFISKPFLLTQVREAISLAAVST